MLPTGAFRSFEVEKYHLAVPILPVYYRPCCQGTQLLRLSALTCYDVFLLVWKTFVLRRKCKVLSVVAIHFDYFCLRIFCAFCICLVLGLLQVVQQKTFWKRIAVRLLFSAPLFASPFQLPDENKRTTQNRWMQKLQQTMTHHQTRSLSILQRKFFMSLSRDQKMVENYVWAGKIS